MQWNPKLAPLSPSPCLLISERYMIALSQHCLPRDPEKINQCFSIFTDLDSNDVNNKELYLACHIIRIGTSCPPSHTPSPYLHVVYHTPHLPHTLHHNFHKHTLLTPSNHPPLFQFYFQFKILFHCLSPGHDLETKKTAMPLRKPHGAAVYSLHKLLTSKQHDERDIQMEVFV